MPIQLCRGCYRAIHTDAKHCPTCGVVNIDPELREIDKKTFFNFSTMMEFRLFMALILVSAFLALIYFSEYFT
jgi:RNA polymerase subunit RPABC4/transcription elongation factor Spt4